MGKAKLSEILKKDAREAALQTTADKATEIVQRFVVAMIKKNSDADTAKEIEKYLGSPEALAFIQLLAGVAIMYAPGAEEKPMVGEIASKLRQGGMSKGMNLVADEFLSLIPQLETLVSSLPIDEVAQLSQATKVEDSKLLEDEHAMLEEVASRGEKRASR